MKRLALMLCMLACFAASGCGIQQKQLPELPAAAGLLSGSAPLRPLGTEGCPFLVGEDRCISFVHEWLLAGIFFIIAQMPEDFTINSEAGKIFSCPF